MAGLKKNGVEVKLQRNALSVLEHPTGNEDDDLDYNSNSSSDIYGKNDDFSGGSIVFHKLNKPRIRHTRPRQYISTKSSNRGIYRELHSIHATLPGVNLSKIGTGSLWRYCRHFNLMSSNSSPSREQMVKAVQRHFAFQLKVDELAITLALIGAALGKSSHVVVPSEW